MSKVTKAFLGCKDGELAATEFNIGDSVEGELGEIALREGWAEAAEAAEDDSSDAGKTKTIKPDANKALKLAPENK